LKAKFYTFLISAAQLCAGVGLGRAQEESVTTHTNFFYWGLPQEIFSAYTAFDGELVKHGVYRDWQEDGSLWHEIEYTDGKFNGWVTTFYPNRQKSDQTFYTAGKMDGLSTTWNRDGNNCAGYVPWRNPWERYVR
jgi:antitoxin component YwqK of YwqJK toxin-antitoxin module